MKYSGITKDGLFIQSNNIEHFKIEDLKSFTITEEMTEEEVDKRFGRYYPLPKNLIK